MNTTLKLYFWYSEFHVIKLNILSQIKYKVLQNYSVKLLCLGIRISFEYKFPLVFTFWGEFISFIQKVIRYYSQSFEKKAVTLFVLFCFV